VEGLRLARPPRRCGPASPTRWQIGKTAEQRLTSRNWCRKGLSTNEFILGRDGFRARPILTVQPPEENIDGVVLNSCRCTVNVGWFDRSNATVGCYSQNIVDLVESSRAAF